MKNSGDGGTPISSELVQENTSTGNLVSVGVKMSKPEL